MRKYSRRSIELLKQCHPDLRPFAWLLLARSDYDLTILGSTVRTLEQQRKFLASGKSKTTNSRHLQVPSMAADIGALLPSGRATWEKEVYDYLGPLGEQCARDLGIAIKWGGRFKGFYDGPHFELSREIYPDVLEVAL